MRARLLILDQSPVYFGVVLLLEREPRRQTNADLKMANETRVLIPAIVEA